jgi:hypothetical protein
MAKNWGVVWLLLGAVVTACPSSDARRGAEAGVAGKAARTGEPFLAKIDHFFATSPKAEAQFNFFRDTLGLAESWPYKSYGEFASGGLSLGNTVLELVTWAVPKGDTLPTEWKSLAFEPVGDTEAALKELGRRGISHSTPDTNRYRNAKGQEVVGWTNTDLTGLTPSDVAFICDYANRSAIDESRKAGHDELARRHGGPLGVIRLKEIVIGVVDVAAASEQWRRLLAHPEQESNGLFHFGDGPSVRLVPAGKAGIREIVIGVRSLSDARRFLEERRLLAIGDGSQVQIAPRAIGGLQVTLVVD